MLFQTIRSDGLAHLSYVIGDEGACAVIDPRRDVQAYLDLARDNDLQITHIVETHVHADFVSGARELAARTGATIYGGRIKNEAQGDYGYAITGLDAGDTLEVGTVCLRALHTPGHSSEHLSLLVSGGGKGAEEPWAVFTGDTLFAGEVGRPDLEPGADHEALARALFDSLHDELMALDDGVEVYPGHGQGSPCGSSIGARDRTTIGYERRHNERLQIDDPAHFVDELMRELKESPAPRYYERLKRLNHEGPPLLGALEAVAPLDADHFAERADADGALVLDTREIEAFAAAHVPGALNIALRRSFPVWAGRMLDPDRELLLVADDAAAVEQARTHLLRIGLELDACLAGGFRSWFEAGRAFDALGLMSVHELRDRLEKGGGGDGDLQILDVRNGGEWKSGHIPGARHAFLPQLDRAIPKLDRERPVLTYCGSGFRASIAASRLKAKGFGEVYNLPGSIKAWQAAGYPLDEP